jgi:aspartate carbamoyltransferase catalytic subunit
MGLKSKDLLGIRELSVEEIRLVLDTAASMKEIASRDIKKVPALRGKTVINLFYEPSTRTRTSFEIAGKWLSADVINISTSASSVVKGESLKDTGLTLQAMHPDVVVIRHAVPGAPHLLARWLKASIINAGDGATSTTQALLDPFTIRSGARPRRLRCHRRGHLVQSGGGPTSSPCKRWGCRSGSVDRRRSCRGTSRAWGWRNPCGSSRPSPMPISS